jgi:uncharacterized protein YneF (UPF0154 family)
MTLPRLYAMSKYFSDNPPLHEVVSALLKSFGVEQEAKKKEKKSIEQMFEELKAAGLG